MPARLAHRASHRASRALRAPDLDEDREKLMNAAKADDELTPRFARRGEATVAARHVIPQQESLPDTAKQIVDDETMLDGNSRLNLATFVGTWMDDDAKQVYEASFDKNMIDKDEYP